MQVDSERNRALFRKLGQLLSRAPSHPQPDTIHLFRTLSRRVESVVSILCPEPAAPERKLLRSLKRLRRHAGQVRDLDVQLAALRKLKIGREAEHRARLLNALSEARADREDELVRWLSEKRRTRLRRRLAHLDRSLQRASTHAAIAASAEPAARPMRNGEEDSLCRGAEAALQSLDPAAEALRRFAAVSRRAGQLTAENLHSFRTASKKIRYLAEMGASERAQAIVESLQSVQVAIGDWHDWDALRLSAEEMFGRSVDSALIMALRNVSQAKFDIARQVATGVRDKLIAQHRHDLAARRASRVRASSTRKSPPRRRPASASHALHATGGVA